MFSEYFEPGEDYIKEIRSKYESFERDFPNMTFGEILANYMIASSGIKGLLHVEDIEDTIENRLDDPAKGRLELINDLRRYQNEAIEYFESLRNKANKSPIPKNSIPKSTGGMLL